MLSNEEKQAILNSAQQERAAIQDIEAKKEFLEARGYIVTKCT